MPLEINNVAGGQAYGNPMVGPVDHTAHIKLDASVLTTDEVDAFGYLKPGVPFKQDGTLVAATQFVFGVTIEAIKVSPANPTNTSLGALTNDPLIAVCTMGQVNRSIAEANLNRAYTAAEIAGFNLAGSKLVLIDNA